jgi:chaperonin GroEL
MRQAASRTNDIAGDGTTTSIVLAQALVEEGRGMIASGVNPIALKRGMDLATRFVSERVRERAIPVEGISDIRRVALVSSGGDARMASLIASAVERVGCHGLVSVVEGGALKDDMRFTEGMSFKQGFVSGYFASDRTRMEVALRDSAVLLTDRKISSFDDDLVPILSLVKESEGGGRGLLIISDGIEKAPLSSLVVNRVRGKLNVVVVQAPGFADRRQLMLSDLAVLTGGHVISGERGNSFGEATMETLGRALKVVVTKEVTSVVSDSNVKGVLSRCKRLRRQLESSDSTYEREKLMERIEKLSGGAALIRAGGATETELKDRRLRLEDAVHATRAAIEEGVIPGGGAALADIANSLSDWSNSSLSGEAFCGAQAVGNALGAPLKRIAHNSGKRGELVLERVLLGTSVHQHLVGQGEVSAKGPNFGFDAVRGTYTDMLRAGIVDPARVTRVALQNATSIASMILTTECLVGQSLAGANEISSLKLLSMTCKNARSGKSSRIEARVQHPWDKK